MPVVTRIEPAGLSRNALSAASSASMPSKCGPRALSSLSPAAVGTTLRVVGVKSRNPSRPSSPRIVWLRAEANNPSCAAARVKLRSCATARKATRVLRFRRDITGDIAPRLAEIADTVLFGEVWRRKGLSQRDRSLITVACLIALYRTNELPFHLGKAIENGVSRDEIVEMITHLAFYSGWPTASTAIAIVRETLPPAIAK